MNLKDILRTLFNIRVEREPLPPGDKPPVGSNIVWESLRMRLRYPINNEQWNWFREQGWRTIDMRFERRNYLCVPDRAMLRLLNAEKREREAFSLILNEEEREEILKQNVRKLYMAMTRAGKRLVVIAYEKFPPFVEELFDVCR